MHSSYSAEKRSSSIEISNLVMQDLTDFELEIEAVKENKDVLINLNFTLHY